MAQSPKMNCLFIINNNKKNKKQVIPYLQTYYEYKTLL